MHVVIRIISFILAVLILTLSLAFVVQISVPYKSAGEARTLFFIHLPFTNRVVVSKLLIMIFFLICIVGGEVQMGPLGTSATEWSIVPAPVDYDDREFGGMKIGRGNRSTRRIPAPAPLCPPQNPLDQTWSRTRAAALDSQRLTA
jgi:hypothetical protein